MKKLLQIIALALFVGVVAAACTEEDVSPAKTKQPEGSTVTVKNDNDW